jgi:hypothetical protein
LAGFQMVISIVRRGRVIICNHFRWVGGTCAGLQVRDLGHSAPGKAYRNAKFCCISNVLGRDGDWVAGPLILRLFGGTTKGALWGVRGFPPFA